MSHGAQLLGKARNRARGGALAPGGAEFLAALKGGCDWYEKLRSYCARVPKEEAKAKKNVAVSDQLPRSGPKKDRNVSRAAKAAEAAVKGRVGRAAKKSGLVVDHFDQPPPNEPMRRRRGG